ncbi:HupE/UreJ family protein [Terasakiella sp.]|uniref:HupE/UreJ family protein n=1 Tax=Terasakiella sp. TaxID=2034861 RepID=UPI003AA9C747
MNRLFFSVAAAGMLLATSAFAHTGGDSVHGFAAGFGHPFAGLDHILAMVAVGVLAAQLGGKAMAYVPASFVAMMLVGGLVAMVGGTVPFVELGIVGSVILLGAVVAFGRQMPLLGAMALVGVLAIFHGFAHGLEMPVNAEGSQYALGFALATTMLHLAGLGISFALKQLDEKIAPLALRIGGGAVGTAGVALLVL